MRAFALTLLVSGLGLSAAPAFAASDLPFTPAFEQAIGQYRDCVIDTLDRTAPARAEAMAQAAMAACEASHKAVHAQLAADISAASPHVSLRTATRSAADGMAAIDPMIASAALDHARAVSDAAGLVKQGNVG